MNEIHQTTHDEHCLKERGIPTALEKFDSFFGLQLVHILFGPAEKASKYLQAKYVSIQEALSSINLLLDFCKRQRSSASFKHFNGGIVKKIAEDQHIGPPKLSKYKIDLL